MINIESEWLDKFNSLKKFIAENNTDIIPSNVIYDGFYLGSWLQKQKKFFRKNSLSNEKIQLLEEIGIDLANTHFDKHWNEMYDILKSYYSKYKHLYIPHSYITEDGTPLGSWLGKQRQSYKKGLLSQDRIDRLNALDTTWKYKMVTSTSFPEQAILFYIKKIFPNTSKFKSKTISEIDVYIPELKIGIEYDGQYSHRNREKDVQKTQNCITEGIKLIRVREPKCPALNDGSTEFLLKDLSYSELENAIKKILKYIDADEIDIDLLRDSLAILDTYIKGIDLNWYEMYEELKKYNNEHGNIDVPFDYVTEDGKTLGTWINTQRDGMKHPNRIRNISSQKIQLLNELNFNWTPLENQWNEMFEYAKNYYLKNNNLLVSSKYSENGITLGSWVHSQRYNYKIGILSEDRIKKLESIGMIWNPLDKVWLENYTIVKDYYSKFNNIDISPDFEYQNKKIGLWIRTQKYNFNRNKLSPDRVNLLNALNIDWKSYTPDNIWNNWYEDAKAYFLENGTINIPINTVYNDKNLGIWITNQRSNYRKGRLDESKIERLNKLKIIWNLINDKWNDLFLQAKQYYNENGNLLIPDNYINEIGTRLGIWLREQRAKYNHNKSEITKDQITLLESIGMVWNVGDYQWDEMYEYARAYYCRHSDLLIPKTYVYEGKKLGYWIQTQRKAYKNKTLSENKIYLLNYIGMVWSPHDDLWIKSYHLFKEYFELNGNCNLPEGYTRDGINIYTWYLHQKQEYLNNTISNDRRALLKQFNFESITLEAKWDEMYKYAIAFYEKNGNLVIPSNSTNKKDKNLELWILRQRKNFQLNNLSEEKIDKLNLIGMNWNPYDNQWDDFYEAAKQYYNENGNLEIPQRYVTKTGKKLGAWISNQRGAYRNNKISTERIELLENIGMIWSQKMEWEDFYQVACKYQSEYGTINISTREEYDGIKLGWWICNQRRYYKNKTLSNEQIELLEKLNIIWSAKMEWNEYYNNVVNYINETNSKKITYRTEYNGIKIGQWIAYQKKNFDNLSEDKKNKLKHLEIL